MKAEMRHGEARIMEELEGTENPSIVRRLWEGWRRVAKRIGDIQARVLLILFYFVVLSPFALAVRWGSDPLAIKPGTPRGWQLKGEREGSAVERATKQF
jgi:lipopolysaccharide/colanic/teichoic acid biosynthesis glycosyltransferase